MSSRVIGAAVVVLALFTSSIASAQTQAEGYVVGSAGGWTAGFNGASLFGGAVGAEAMPSRYFGIGGEAAGLTTATGNAMLAFSGNGRVHFPVRGSRVTPFAGGGYSRLFFFYNGENAYNVSGGFDYRLNDQRAIRLEVRDFIRPSTSYTAHYWGIRVGVTFR